LQRTVSAICGGQQTALHKLELRLAARGHLHALGHFLIGLDQAGSGTERRHRNGSGKRCAKRSDSGFQLASGYSVASSLPLKLAEPAFSLAGRSLYAIKVAGSLQAACAVHAQDKAGVFGHAFLRA
jgi:hypothetical protein